VRRKIEYIFEKVAVFRNRIFSKKGVMPINQGDEIQFKEFHGNKKEEKVMRLEVDMRGVNQFIKPIHFKNRRNSNAKTINGEKRL
jgi:hypothetical protein